MQPSEVKTKYSFRQLAMMNTEIDYGTYLPIASFRMQLPDGGGDHTEI